MLKLKIAHLLLIVTMTVLFTVAAISPVATQASPVSDNLRPEFEIVDDVVVVWIDPNTGTLATGTATPANAPYTQTNLNKQQKVANWIASAGDGAWTQVGSKVYFASVHYVSAE
jgi:hypothetical protein